MEDLLIPFSILFGIGLIVMILLNLLSLAIWALLLQIPIRMLGGLRTGFFSVLLTVLLVVAFYLGAAFALALGAETYQFSETTVQYLSTALFLFMIFVHSLFVASRHRLNILRGLLAILGAVLLMAVVIAIIAVLALILGRVTGGLNP